MDLLYWFSHLLFVSLLCFLNFLSKYIGKRLLCLDNRPMNRNL